MKTNTTPIYVYGKIVPEDIVAELAEDGVTKNEVKDFFEFLGFAS